jgi:hypothetical protein
VRLPGAIGSGVGSTDNKIKTDVVVANEQQEGDGATRGTWEGRQPGGCCRRRDKHAREISLRGQWPPKNGTLAIRGGWCTGVGPGRGLLRREKLNGCFFQGRRQERHKRAVLRSLCPPRMARSRRCPILWARFHTNVRRPSSSGLVECSARIHPACFRCDDPKRRRRLPASFLGLARRRRLRGGSGTRRYSIRRRRQQCTYFSGGRIGTGKRRSGRRPS